MLSVYPLAQRCSLYSWPCPDPLKLDSKLDRCVMYERMLVATMSPALAESMRYAGSLR